MSRAKEGAFGTMALMKEPTKVAASQFKRAFLARTAQARTRAGFSQSEIAELLGIPQDKYKQYEKRSPLPHYLISTFCIATRCEPAWLFGLPAKRGAIIEPKAPARLVPNNKH